MLIKAVKKRKKEGKTVSTCTEVQYAILCPMLENCPRCCRRVLLVFKSFIYPSYDLECLFYSGMPLPEAEVMIQY
jgi:hypothetical protein